MSETYNEVEELERSAGFAPGRYSAELEAPLDIDGSEVELSGLLAEGKYPCRIISIEVKQGKANIDTGSNGTKYGEFKWQVLAGPAKDAKITDRVMLEGSGKKRMVFLAAALGFYNAETKKVFGRLVDFMHKCAWLDIEIEDNVYKGKTRKQNRVGFEGFEPIDAYLMPDEEDMFATEEQFTDPEPVAPVKPTTTLPLKVPVAPPAPVVSDEFAPDEEEEIDALEESVAAMAPVAPAPTPRRAAAAGNRSPWPE